MVEEKVLVVGLGDVGRPLFELLKECGRFEVYGLDVDEDKMRAVGQSVSALPEEVDVMHVCIPCGDRIRFVEIVAGYTDKFKPKLLIVNSTVPPGTTMDVYRRCPKCLVAHSPVRGVHRSLDYMKWELKRWTKYIGGVNAEAGEVARKHFEKAGFKTKVLKGCAETELAKLFETTYRAWMIACFQEMHRISRHFGADFDEVVDMLEDIHRVRFNKPLHYPGVIGGHCLIPNTELLLKSYDSEFLRLILKSNEKRKIEITDESVKEEIEKVKKRVETLEKELTKRCG